MNLTILHGDNHLESRNALQELLETAKKQNKQTRILNGQKLTKPELEGYLMTGNLFEEDIVVIQDLLSRISSKEKKSCLEFLISYSGNKQVILWEGKTVRKLVLKKLAHHNITSKSFTIPLKIFTFVADLKPRNTKNSLTKFHESLNSASNTFIFAMLTKQISKLIIAKSTPESLTGQGWQNSKVIKQAREWSVEQLKLAHKKLLLIDNNIKTGNTKLDLTQLLDIFLIEL